MENGELPKILKDKIELKASSSPSFIINQSKLMIAAKDKTRRISILRGPPISTLPFTSSSSPSPNPPSLHPLHCVSTCSIEHNIDIVNFKAIDRGPAIWIYDAGIR